MPCPIDPHVQTDPTGIACVLPPVDPAAPTLLARSDQQENNTDSHDVPESGLLRPVAAKILMKILYGARMARYDLLKAVCHSASCITKWTRQNDVDVYRLICYIQTTIEYCQHSFCGNSAQELQLAVYADADWAGDTRTHKSTSGCALTLLASHTKCMLSASSRRQTCTSHSTPEAEIVAADAALRTEALPAIPLWEHMLK